MVGGTGNLGAGLSLYLFWATKTLDTAEGAGDLAVTATWCKMGSCHGKPSGSFPGAPVPPPVSVYSGETPQHHLEKWFHWPPPPLCLLHPDQGTTTGLSAGGQMSK